MYNYNQIYWTTFALFKMQKCKKKLTELSAVIVQKDQGTKKGAKKHLVAELKPEQL